MAACRAAVFASLIPDPDDPECPDSFRTLVNDLLPRTPSPGAPGDTPRNRCLEFIKHVVEWENSNSKALIGKARSVRSEGWRRAVQQERRKGKASGAGEIDGIALTRLRLT